ncbi:MAG: hypothetical protein HOV80_02855 [Polyangiaceae bacterium]|nr:hypothetical protein [Polyangiaceae bacterium]
MAYLRGFARSFLVMLVAACGGRTEIDLPTEEAVTVGPTTGVGAGGSGGAPIECNDRSFTGDKQGAVRIVADDEHAFWTTVTNQIERGDLSTGETSELTDPFLAFVGALGLGDDHVYLGTYAELSRVPKKGGALELLTPWQMTPVDMAVDGDEVFVLHYGSIGTGSVLHWSPASGLSVLFQGLDLPTSMALDESYVYVAAQGYVLEGEFVFRGAVLRIDRDTGETVIAIPDLVDPFGLCLQDGVLYVGEWYDEVANFDARVLRAPKTGGAAELVGRISETALPLGLACDKTHAYVTLPDFEITQSGARSQLLRIPLAGGEAAAVAGPENAYFAEPAVNDTHVVFTVQNGQNGNPPPTNVVANARALCK